MGRPALGPAASALSDPVWQFVPWVELARSELGAGRLPLWNPHQEAGQPLLGNGSLGLPSPLLWPALALPLFPGWNLSLLLRILVAAAGGWALARDFGRTRVASLLAALVCSLSGPFVAWLEHPQTLTAAAVPWLLLAVRRSAHAGGAGRIAAVAATTALVLAGGHHETALMAAFLAAALLAAESKGLRDAGRPVGGALLGAGLSAPFLLPFLEYLFRSAAWAGADRHLSALPLRDLLRFVVPSLPGSHPIEGAAYLSLAVLPLAALGAAAGEGSARGGSSSSSPVSSSSRPTTAPSRGSSREGRRSAGAGRSSSSRFPPPSSPRAGSTGSSSGRRGRGAPPRRCSASRSSRGAGRAPAAARGVHAVTPPAARRLGAPILERALRATRPSTGSCRSTLSFPRTRARRSGSTTCAATTPSRRSSGASGRRSGRFRGVPTHTDVLAPWDLAPGGAELDAWNVKYLLLHPQFAFSAPTLNDRLGLDLVEVYSGPDGKLLENRRVRPRARVERDGREEGEVRIVERSSTRWLFEVTSPSGGNARRRERGLSRLGGPGGRPPRRGWRRRRPEAGDPGPRGAAPRRARLPAALVPAGAPPGRGLGGGPRPPRRRRAAAASAPVARRPAVREDRELPARLGDGVRGDVGDEDGLLLRGRDDRLAPRADERGVAEVAKPVPLADAVHAGDEREVLDGAGAQERLQWCRRRSGQFAMTA